MVPGRAVPVRPDSRNLAATDLRTRWSAPPSSARTPRRIAADRQPRRDRRRALQPRPAFEDGSSAPPAARCTRVADRRSTAPLACRPGKPDAAPPGSAPVDSVAGACDAPRPPRPAGVARRIDVAKRARRPACRCCAHRSRTPQASASDGSAAPAPRAPRRAGGRRQRTLSARRPRRSGRRRRRAQSRRACARAGLRRGRHRGGRRRSRPPRATRRGSPPAVTASMALAREPEAPRAARRSRAASCRHVRSVVCVALCHDAGARRRARRRARPHRALRRGRGLPPRDARQAARARSARSTRAAAGLARAVVLRTPARSSSAAGPSAPGSAGSASTPGCCRARIGSWFLLGEVLVDRELEPDRAARAADHCGTCRALHRRLPDRRHRRALPARRAALHLVPHDRAARPDPARAARRWSATGSSAATCARKSARGTASPRRRARRACTPARSRAGRSSGSSTLDDAAFDALFAAQPDPARAARRVPAQRVRGARQSRERRRCRRWPRTLAHETEPLVRAHAAWALGEIGRREPGAVAEHARAALDRAARGDSDEGVREEAALALK